MTDIKQKYVTSIELNSTKLTATVTETRPAGESGAVAEIVHTVDLKKPGTKLRRALKVLTDELVTVIDTDGNRGPVSCNQGRGCIATCCARMYDWVTVEAADIERMRSLTDEVVNDLVDWLPGNSLKKYTPDWRGVVAHMKRVKDPDELEGFTHKCVALDASNRCSIYGVRPNTCSEYPGHNCENYIERKQTWKV